MKAAIRTPKYVKTREYLKEKIVNGDFPPETRLPTFTQLQKQLKISDNTLLRAISDLESEGLLLRRRGSGTWVVNKSNAPLINGRKLNIGILFRSTLDIDCLTSGFLADMLKGILDEWHINEKEPRLSMDAGVSDSLFFWEHKERGVRIECLGPSKSSVSNYPDMTSIKLGQYDGLVLLGINEESWIQKLLKLDIPLILTDYPGHRFLKGADQIFVNPLCGYHEAVNYFITNGLKNIHFFGALVGPERPEKYISKKDWPQYVVDNLRVDPDSTLRLNAWRQAMQLQGLLVDDKQIHYETFNPKRIRVVIDNLIENSVNKMPEAFVCHCSSQAEAIIQIFKDHDIVVEAHDSIESGAAHQILVHGCELGEIAAELLISRLVKRPKHYLSIGVNMTFAENSN